MRARASSARLAWKPPWRALDAAACSSRSVCGAALRAPSVSGSAMRSSEAKAPTSAEMAVCARCASLTARVAARASCACCHAPQEVAESQSEAAAPGTATPQKQARKRF
ncbi:hypothetical protein ACFQU7_18930 [Pseudoroseomonas wenyumeiae]